SAWIASNLATECGKGRGKTANANKPAEIDRTKEAAETHGWDDDLIASDLVYANVRGETSRVAYNPTHRWYYFSDMQPDEVRFIRLHDSANDGRARLSFHTSFDNPLTPAAPPRERIEVRTLVFFPPAA